VPRGDEDWLSLALLVPAWASELAQAGINPSQLEDDLWQALHRDITVGCFDHSGPRRNGRRLGLAVIDHNGRFRYVSGRLLGTVHFPFRKQGHRIFLAKKAIPDFARRHRLRLPSLCSDATKRETQPSRPQVELKPAPDRIVIEAIRRAYDNAEDAGRKPPNIRELPAAVQPFLQRKGFSASGRRIQQLGDDGEFKRRRRPPGKTVASERQK
jgi:hypothetical protein